jgi:hypothetical protein
VAIQACTASGAVVTAGADARLQVVDPRASWAPRCTHTEHSDFICKGSLPSLPPTLYAAPTRTARPPSTRRGRGRVIGQASDLFKGATCKRQGYDGTRHSPYEAMGVFAWMVARTERQSGCYASSGVCLCPLTASAWLCVFGGRGADTLRVAGRLCFSGAGNGMLHCHDMCTDSLLYGLGANKHAVSAKGRHTSPEVHCSLPA